MDVKLSRVARAFKVSSETVRNWANRKGLPCRCIEDERIFNSSEVEAWAKKNGKQLDPRWLE